jgi:D-methionine transport system ATP-binding protein
VQTAQLRLKQVSLSALVGSNYLLKDISFEVSAGDRIAIIGPSGAGKTSLLRLLNRLSEPTAGSIYFENQEYRQIPRPPATPTSYTRAARV